MSWWSRAWLCACVLWVVGCGEEFKPVQRCAADVDCPFAQVCATERGECAVVRCQPDAPTCVGDQLCIELPTGDAICTLPQCVDESRCAGNEVCEAGQCRRRVCTTSEDCPSSRTCGDLKECVAPPEVCKRDAECPFGRRCAPSGACTSPCVSDSACVYGQVCLLGQGVCDAVPCVGEDGEVNCLEGQRCERFVGVGELCTRPECYSSAECARGQLCFQEQCITARCMSREDCPSGAVCGADGLCMDATGLCGTDLDCPKGQICFSDGMCDVGCVADADCEAGKYCDAGARVCATGCRDSMECGQGQVCGVNRVCACTETSCPAGRVCELGACVPLGSVSCDMVTCQEGFFCDPMGVECKFGCTAEPGRYNSCALGTQCNTATGACIASACGARDGSECVGTTRPLWNAERCFCAECLTSAQCGADEFCDGNGNCLSGQCAACDPQTPGVCGVGANAGQPYCVGGCCAECVGSGDCAADEVCRGGACQQISCTQDPTVCPQGTSCQSGMCQPTQMGQMCDPQRPNTCPASQSCNPNTRTCQPAACGSCLPGCTCDGGLTCDGSFCVGCTEGADPRCPPGLFGMPLCSGGVCL